MAYYNILLAADIKYIPYCFVTCQSVINSLNRGLNETSATVSNLKDSIIFTIALDSSVNIDELDHKYQNFIKRNSSAINISFKLKNIDNSLFEGAPTLRQSFSTYYRVVIDRIYDNSVDYVLYLDCDVLVRKDVRTLFQIAKSSQAILSGVIDHAAEPFQPGTDFGILPSLSKSFKPITIQLDKYFNAGILVFNLNKYREKNISESCLKLMHTHQLKFHDQDLLNVIVQDKFCLDIDWNFQDRFYFNQFSEKTGKYSIIPYISPSSRRDALDTLPNAQVYLQTLKDPAICHFTGFKPWMTFCYIPSSIPNKHLNERLREWYSTAATIEEFADELEPLKYSNMHNTDFIDCILDKRLSYYNFRNNKKRKNDRIVIFTILFILLMTQIAILTMLLNE